MNQCVCIYIFTEKFAQTHQYKPIIRNTICKGGEQQKESLLALFLVKDFSSIFF